MTNIVDNLRCSLKLQTAHTTNEAALDKQRQTSSAARKDPGEVWAAYSRILADVSALKPHVVRLNE